MISCVHNQHDKLGVKIRSQFDLQKNSVKEKTLLLCKREKESKNYKLNAKAPIFSLFSYYFGILFFFIFLKMFKVRSPLLLFPACRRQRNKTIERLGCWIWGRQGVSRGPVFRPARPLRVAASAAILWGGVGWGVVGGALILTDGDGDVVMREAELFVPGLWDASWRPHIQARPVSRYLLTVKESYSTNIITKN